MLILLTIEQAREFSDVGFRIEDGSEFRTRTDCGGVPPFRTSTECHAICFGQNGICTSKKLPILCLHDGETIAIRKKQDRGPLGFRPMAGIADM